MNEAQKVLDEICEEYENAETVQAPSGEWAEYNVDYLQKESAAWAAERLGNAIGSCGECIHYSEYMIDPGGPANIITYKGCSVFKLDKGPEWYCADFERKPEESTEDV